MDQLLAKLIDLATEAGGKILVALLTFIIGRILVKTVLKTLSKSKALQKVDETVRTFSLSFVKGLLYVLLFIAVISVLGVPMTSVITVLASCGVAIGLALQGALSNLAGGIMLMLFKPFKIGDFVEANGVSGTIREVNLFYTVFITLDNKRVTVPNGTLMNANVIDYSAESTRRVDLVFSTAKSEDPNHIQQLMQDAAAATDAILPTPAVFARISNITDDSIEFTIRVWCKTEDYWNVYHDLTQSVTETFQKAGVQQPAAKITVAND